MSTVPREKSLLVARSIPIERIVNERGIRLRGRIERVGPCPLCGGQDRFSINIRKQVWNCRGCSKGGDVIAFVQFLDGISFREACAQLLGERFSSGPQINHARHGTIPFLFSAENYERQQRDKARWLWRASSAVSGTPVEKYMQVRCIGLPLPTRVRFLPPLKPDHHPAMLVPYGLPLEPEPGVLDISEDAIAAIQLTLLKPDGSGKADVKPNKITIASPDGAPMVLAPINDLMGLAITEGCEDAMSVHRATGLGAWAGGGWSFMPKLASAVPAYVEAVTICGHPDEGGRRGAHELADALIARGIEVFVEGILS
jgi:hypothetical protein